MGQTNQLILPETTRQRELDCWRLRLEGLSQEEIAEQLGLTQQGVSKILRRIDQRCKMEIDRQVHELRVEQAEAYNVLEAEAMASWEASKLNPTKRLPHGDPRFLNAAILARTARGRLYGLDAPRVLQVEAPKTEKPLLNPEVQRRMHADPELMALALQRDRIDHQIKQKQLGADTNRAKGVWGQLDRHPGPEHGPDSDDD